MLGGILGEGIHYTLGLGLSVGCQDPTGNVPAVLCLCSGLCLLELPLVIKGLI